MITFLLRRLLLLLPRLILGWAAVVVVIEFSMTGSAGSGGRSPALFKMLATGERPDSSGELWRDSWWHAGLASLEVTALATLLLLAFGPLLGVLTARFRRFAWFEVMLSPFLLAAWIPGFWLACLLVWAQFEFWNQPGFADADAATGGPVRWESLWRIVLVAVPVALPAIGWQLRRVGGALKRTARAPHVRATLSRGVGGATLFYRHIFRNSLEPLIRSFDRVLPVMLGMQLVIEWASRYPGLGRLAVDSARASEFSGLLAAGLAMVSVTVAARWLGETIWAMRIRKVPVPNR
ncbi:MAG: ABC transporter permease subunit [Verrucomicrobiae bacterium]|nr:ABC transporter permease subunit [Verrucomicrobiae bacterium]